MSTCRDTSGPEALRATRESPAAAGSAPSSTLADAIAALGTGFLSHASNTGLRAKFIDRRMDASAYRDQLTWLTIRLLFFLIAVDRDLLCRPDASGAARARFRDLPTRRLRSIAAGRSAEHRNLWSDLDRNAAALAHPHGAPDLALPYLGSTLWSASSTPDLLGPHGLPNGGSVALDNAVLLDAVRALEPLLRAASVDGASDGTECLGAAYECLLELEPLVDLDAGEFAWRPNRTSQRRERGSFYTPRRLVEHLLDTALEPVISERLRSCRSRSDRERAVLSTRVCDPATGAGHVLAGAARRLAAHLTRVRSGDHTDGHGVDRHALHDVVTACVFGVDIDPVAAELCRIRLWLDAGAAGKPLAAFGRQIRVGNAVVGATPTALAEGIPDEAFTARHGDSARAASRYRSRNRTERATRPSSPAIPAHAHHAADAWCASFVWCLRDPDAPDPADACPSVRDAITQRTVWAIERDPASVPAWMRHEISRIASDLGFFHWHLEFPDVFSGAVEDRGFDVIIGNPPFLNQLESATASARGPAAIIAATTGGAVRGYADLSSAFLLRSTSMTRRGGRVALVQPQSLLAAKDAGPVRRAVLDAASLTDLWVAAEHAFEGTSVYTCAPTLHVGGARVGPLSRTRARRCEPVGELTIDNDALRSDETWAHLAAAAFGVPEFDRDVAGTLGDIAVATADFRDQYYGLDGFLVEDDDVANSTHDLDGRFPPIVTTGLIDLARCDWSRRPTRLLKRRWRAPRIDRAQMHARGTLSDWIDRRCVPKVILATQTRVLEVFVDEPGRLVPSLPLITVQPRSDADLWRIAAAIASPVNAALAMRRYAGTALTAQAIKLSAKQALALPIPGNERAWNTAADLLRNAQHEPNPDRQADALGAFARASIEAFRVPAGQSKALFDWWAERWSPTRRATPACV